MNRKEELKKLIEEQKEESGFFKFNRTKKDALMGLIISPILVIVAILDWFFNFIDYSNGTSPELYRPLTLLIGISFFIYSWISYKNKTRKEKEKNDKIEKLINELKE